MMHIRKVHYKRQESSHPCHKTSKPEDKLTPTSLDVKLVATLSVVVGGGGFSFLVLSSFSVAAAAAVETISHAAVIDRVSEFSASGTNCTS